MGLVQIFPKLLEHIHCLALVLDQVLATLTLDPLFEVASGVLLGLYCVELVHNGVKGFLLLQDNLSQGLLCNEIHDLLSVGDFEPGD